MTEERRASTGPVLEKLRELVDGLNHLRESNHKLGNQAAVQGLRTERIERDVHQLKVKVDTALDDQAGSAMGRAMGSFGQENRARIERLEKRTEEHDDFILQLRTALGLLKLLAGASALGALASFASAAKALGWW